MGFSFFFLCDLCTAIRQNPFTLRKFFVLLKSFCGIGTYDKRIGQKDGGQKNEPIQLSHGWTQMNTDKASTGKAICVYLCPSVALNPFRLGRGPAASFFCPQFFCPFFIRAYPRHPRLFFIRVIRVIRGCHLWLRLGCARSSALSAFQLFVPFVCFVDNQGK